MEEEFRLAHVAAGYKELDHLEKDADLQALRARQDFRALVADIRKKSKVLRWTEDLEAAKVLARKEKIDLFLWFGGSDWADHGVILRKTQLAKAAFFDYPSTL